MFPHRLVTRSLLLLMYAQTGVDQPSCGLCDGDFRRCGNTLSGRIALP